MKILFVFPKSRQKFEKDFASGNTPSTIFYGQKELIKMGINASYSDIAFSRRNILYWVLFPLQQIFVTFTGLGFKIDQAILLLPRLRNSDLIVATSDSAGLPIALLKILKLIKTPLIYTTIGLVGQDKVYGSNWAFKLCGRLLQTADKIICYSKIEKELLVKNFSVDRNKIIFLPFCVDVNFYHSTDRKSSGEVLTVGRDLGRDYKLLLDVARQLPKVKFNLICSPHNLNGINLPDNVRIEFDIDFVTLRKRYQEAEFVILPLKETQRASGQIVLLESMASGKSVIVSNVLGLSQVYDLRSMQNCILVPASDPVCLTKEIQRLRNDRILRKKIGRQARKTVVAHYSQEKVYVQQLVKIIKSIS